MMFSIGLSHFCFATFGGTVKDIPLFPAKGHIFVMVRRNMDMWIVVDIDGTICGANAAQIFGAFHCQDLGLTIASETLATVTSYAELVQLPQVRVFWRDHQEEWTASRRRAVMAPSVLAALAPLPGAVEGLRQLATAGSLCYLSARSSQVHPVTLAWLERHGFP
ncbi:MAG: hypothetical protein J2P36_36575, partial [Ktedonobacteraceae bacterium]|nr:hypothetical protein [Ktedonobacteraceae bacterium]